MLHEISTIPKVVYPAIVNRVKALARMDISEKRRPQDGRIKTERDGKEVELRISTVPVAFGEKIVMRIFDPDMLIRDLASLGFGHDELELFEEFIGHPHGIVLVTGPTGSGKTTTLYSALKILAQPGVNVTTIEDPIEMVMPQLNQIAVHAKIGLTFAHALRTILRQDPDIIMVGEIRDIETADNAVQAALTGHLVLSTLHTNDAPSAITRLQDLGIPNFLLPSTLLGIMAQRLVRVICPRCKEDHLLGPGGAAHPGNPAREADARSWPSAGRGASTAGRRATSGARESTRSSRSTTRSATSSSRRPTPSSSGRRPSRAAWSPSRTPRSPSSPAASPPSTRSSESPGFEAGEWRRRGNAVRRGVRVLLKAEQRSSTREAARGLKTDEC